VWDATCVNTYAASHLPSAAVAAGAAAGDAEAAKTRKYSGLAQRYHFQPVAYETSGACGPTTRQFVRQLGARLTAVTGDAREPAWLWQRLALAVVRGNAASVLLTMGTSAPPVRTPTPLPPPLPPPPPSPAPPQSSSPVDRPRQQASRDPLDDPELARYLRPRAGPSPARRAPTPDLNTQELTDQLLHLSINAADPGPPRPNPLPGFRAIFELRRGEGI